MKKTVTLSKKGRNYELKVTNPGNKDHFILTDNYETVSILLKGTTIETLLKEFNKLKGNKLCLKKKK